MQMFETDALPQHATTFVALCLFQLVGFCRDQLVVYAMRTLYNPTSNLICLWLDPLYMIHTSQQVTKGYICIFK